MFVACKVNFVPVMNEPISTSAAKNKNFQSFLVARFSFIMAMQMISLNLAWYIYELTGNKLSLGLLGLSEIIPAILLALYAGHVIDKSDKRSLLLTGIIIYMVVSITLGLVCSAKARDLLGMHGVEYSIYALVFCSGILRAFTGPTQQSIVAQLVTKAQLPKAITIGSASWQTASVVGPVLGGVLISTIGIPRAFLFAIGFLVLAAIAVFLIPKLPIANTNNNRTWHSVKEGIAYVYKTKTLFSALSVDMFAVFFGGAIAMLPVYAKDILHIDATGMGILRGAQGTGTVLILFLLTHWPIRKKHGRIMLQSVAMFGISIIVFAVSKNFWLSFIALFFSGIFDGISVVIRSTILQLFVPDDMRGRVTSVNSIFVNSSNELGQFESGVTAKLMGTVPSVLLGGCMTIIVVIIAWVKAPMLRETEY